MRILRRFRERERLFEAALRLALRRRGHRDIDDDVLAAAIAEFEPKAAGDDFDSIFQAIQQILELILEFIKKLMALLDQ